jgi:hypothetical protein
MKRICPVIGAMNIRQIWFGAERTYWLYAAIYASFCFLILEAPIFAFGAIVPIVIGRFLTDIDVDLPQVYLRYSQQAEHYRDISSIHAKQKNRPIGFGRKL